VFNTFTFLSTNRFDLSKTRPQDRVYKTNTHFRSNAQVPTRATFRYTTCPEFYDLTSTETNFARRKFSLIFPEPLSRPGNPKSDCFVFIESGSKVSGTVFFLYLSSHTRHDDVRKKFFLYENNCFGFMTA